MSHINNKNRVLIFIPKGFELMELGPFTDVLGWSKDHGKLNIEFDTVGFSKTVVGAFGYKYFVDEILENEIGIDKYSGFAMPGGFENYGFFDDCFDERLMKLIRSFEKEKKPIATICVAAFALGEAGILKGKKATTYNKLSGRKQKQLGQYGCEIINEPVVTYDNIITSYGPQTAPEVAFRLLEKLVGEEECNKVKDMMCF